MKKLLILILVLCVAAFITYQLLPKKPNDPPENKDKPLAIEGQSGPFNSSFSNIMEDYYSLEAALADWDIDQANLSAGRLEKNCDNLKFKTLKADSSVVLTAKNFSDSIKSQSRRLLAEKEIEQKRRTFNEITGQLFDLIRTTRYPGGIIYHIRCPMAFHDSSEGFWLSSTSKIVNPYLGRKHPKYKDKMIGCGEIMDSLDFSIK